MGFFDTASCVSGVGDGVEISGADCTQQLTVRVGHERPDLMVGLVVTRDAHERPAEEAVGIVAHVTEVTATIRNVGDADADETITRFWVRGLDGDDIDREFRVVHTPPLPPGDEVEVTALWDVRNRNGRYAITVTADVFRQIDQAARDHTSATIHVLVRGSHVQPV